MNKGFTLLEVLVALAILAVLITVVYGAFDHTVRSADALEEEQETYRVARQGLSLLGGEVRSAYWNKEHPEDYVFEGRADSLTLTTLSASGGSFPFLEGPLLSVPTEVSYFLETRQSETGLFLMRSESSLSSSSSSAGEVHEVGGRIKSFTLRYFDGEEWRESWDSTEEKKIPAAVEAQLVFLVRGEGERTFSSLVEIPLGRKE